MPVDEPFYQELLAAFWNNRFFFLIVGMILFGLSVFEKLERFFWKRVFVKQNTEIMLQHFLSKQYLLSPNTNARYTHENTSGQQQVGCSDKFRDTWIIRHVGENEDSDKVLSNGDIVYIVHKRTGAYLHSHNNHPSPLTRQQEATLWPFKDDENNSWQIIIMDNEHRGRTIQASSREGKRVRFLHVLTKTYLHSHSGHSDPVLTSGFQEVTCYWHEQDENNDWILFVTPESYNKAGNHVSTSTRARSSNLTSPLANNRRENSSNAPNQFNGETITDKEKKE